MTKGTKMKTMPVFLVSFFVSALYPPLCFELRIMHKAFALGLRVLSLDLQQRLFFWVAAECQSHKRCAERRRFSQPPQLFLGVPPTDEHANNWWKETKTKQVEC